MSDQFMHPSSPELVTHIQPFFMASIYSI